MKLISRAIAKQQKDTYYFTNTPCKNGHISKRRVANCTCYECELAVTKRKRSPEIKQKYDSLYSSIHWRRFFNQARASANTARYRARVKRAIPTWFKRDEDQIKKLYKQSQLLTETTGIRHQVDHIVPISGDSVCGLHCINNLQILTAEENVQKSNKLLNRYL